MAANVHVILSRDVSLLGRVGEVVKVKPGYARNFLFPKGLAMPASPGRVKFFEHQKQMVEHQRRKLRSESEKLKEKLGGVTLTITAKSGQQGKLFGSVGTRDIEKVLKKEGFTVSHRDVLLDAPIKSIGLHQVPVRLEADVRAQIKVVVAAEAEEKSDETESEPGEQAKDSEEEVAKSQADEAEEGTKSST